MSPDYDTLKPHGFRALSPEKNQPRINANQLQSG
jgi:hypothetical protein